MTVGQCYDKVRKLLNYYSAGGTPLPAREGDLWPRAAALMDTAHKEFARQDPRLTSWVLTQRRLPNLLPELVPFWVGANAVEVSAEGAQSLTFATDGPLEVRVTRTADGAAQEAAALSCPAGEMRVFSASFPSDTGGTVTVRLSGGAYVWDLALYAQSFDGTEVPAYGEYRWQALPEDCARVCTLELRPLGGAVRRDFRDYRLKKGQIGLPWGFDGTATLVYERAPAAITDDTPEDTELDVDDAGGEYMACFTAAHLVAEEDPGLFELLMSTCRTMLERSRPGFRGCSQVNSLYLGRAGRFSR